ncbi:MAG: hypothetical protein ACC657_14730 [Thiohalomonadales bacterium]
MKAKTKTSNNQLAITAVGLKSVTGNRDFALFGAIATMLNASKQDPFIEVPSDDGVEPALVASIAAFENVNSIERMLIFLQDAILDATDYLLEHQLENKKHLVFIVLPASAFERSKLIETKEWRKYIQDKLESFTDLHFHFINADSNVIKHLTAACKKLVDEEIDSIIFAGSDTLVDVSTINELIQKRKMCTNTQPNGVIPGEAAACVIIQTIDPKKQPHCAIVKGLVTEEEPNSTKPDKKELTGLSQAIQNAAQLAGQQTESIECIVRNGIHEQHYELEWYQTTQRLWPNKLPEQLRVAYQLGELDEPPILKDRKLPEELIPNITLGEIGAASVPLGLILACARFDFTYPSVKNCIICEINEFLFRGVIWLENPGLK